MENTSNYSLLVNWEYLATSEMKKPSCYYGSSQESEVKVLSHETFAYYCKQTHPIPTCCPFLTRLIILVWFPLLTLVLRFTPSPHIPQIRLLLSKKSPKAQFSGGVTHLTLAAFEAVPTQAPLGPAEVRK